LIQHRRDEGGDLRRSGLKEHPAVLAASSERDRPGENPARFAEALHGAPHPGRGGGRLIPPLPLDQFGQRELVGGQQPLPLPRRPLLDPLDVAAHALAACHG
jgi:hypothetical protein